jgi:CheY-like chemotaxis protein
MNNSISSELNPTVLIVDDSSLSRKIIADLLNGEGFHIIFGKVAKRQ